MATVKSIERPGRSSRKSPREKSFCRLEPETFEIGAELVPEIRPGQGEIHRRLEEAQLVAGVVAASLELHGVDRPPLPQRAEPVGELDLAPRIGRGLRQDREQIR